MSCVHPLHSLQRWTITPQGMVFSSISNGLLMCLNKAAAFLKCAIIGAWRLAFVCQTDCFFYKHIFNSNHRAAKQLHNCSVAIRSAHTCWIFSWWNMLHLHHQWRLWCMTCLTRLINDLSKAHTTSLGKGCRHREMQAGRGMRAIAESESRTLKLQMVFLTGVIIIGNYTALVILWLHNVWYFSSNFSYTSHHKSVLNTDDYWNWKEQHIEAVSQPLYCTKNNMIFWKRFQIRPVLKIANFHLANLKKIC